jgi:hypothetical protein
VVCGVFLDGELHILYVDRGRDGFNQSREVSVGGGDWYRGRCLVCTRLYSTDHGAGWLGFLVLGVVGKLLWNVFHLGVAWWVSGGVLCVSGVNGHV